jgi:hypothetical protein
VGGYEVFYSSSFEMKSWLQKSEILKPRELSEDFAVTAISHDVYAWPANLFYHPTPHRCWLKCAVSASHVSTAKAGDK